MIVTFVSECQGNSLKLTRRVLDAHAHRIGRRTWQTVITEQGLAAVRGRLSRTARKSTAVACHRVRATRRTELLWNVGNRRKFDDKGNVPVHQTGRDLLRDYDANDWQFLSTVQCLVGIAGVFHDVGKAWKPFQDVLLTGTGGGKQRRDPVRHEWISLLLFLAFVENKQDVQWLAEIVAWHDQSDAERRKVSDRWIKQGKSFAQQNPYPFVDTLTPLQRWIAWLIVSHHKLPIRLKDTYGPESNVDAAALLRQVCLANGYDKPGGPHLDLAKHWKFPASLPVLSSAWCRAARRWSRKLFDEIQLHGNSRIASLASAQRLALTLARMSLMLGDHQYSSRREDPKWGSRIEADARYQPRANTYAQAVTDQKSGTRIPKGTPRQWLDEHLVRVTESAVEIVHLLPSMESALPRAMDVRPLRKPSPNAFRWQNRVIEAVSKWRLDHRLERQGFFAVNMASTGQGKTFANAKIMDALSPHGLRYSLALGLRTLTLQTGDEYRSKLRLDETQLAVLIGSAAMADLHRQRVEDASCTSSKATADEDAEVGGSESEAALSDGFEFADDDLIPDDAISTAIDDPKSRQLLKSPVLVCTIDHLMPAVEGTTGGRQILPMLRMLSADLVIDEVDDFDHLDLPAIARLVHLAGMLGGKLMISSATISPAIATGLYHAYQQGWIQFARFRDRDPSVACLWADEYAASIERINGDDHYAGQHSKFAARRAKRLGEERTVRRRAEVRPVVDASCVNTTSPRSADEIPDRSEVSLNRDAEYSDSLAQAAFDLHRRHAEVDRETNQRLSVGVIRMANVDPCIDMAKYLSDGPLPEDIDVRVICYHARQVLLLRSLTEHYLDRLLNRKSHRSPCQDPLIQQHLRATDKPSVMFVVVASPVVEVGRDHDYDWAVIEPSSMRSIIQMAGRVLRHRTPVQTVIEPNVVLPDLNRKAFLGSGDIVFSHAGYEGGSPQRESGYVLRSKSLRDLIDVDAVADRLDSTPRIIRPNQLDAEGRLSDLEHAVMHNILVRANHRPAFNHGWTACDYYLSDLAQRSAPFRQSSPESIFKLHVTDDETLEFWRADARTGRCAYPRGSIADNIAMQEEPEHPPRRRWLELDYVDQIERHRHRFDYGRWKACERFGEMRLGDDFGNRQFCWQPDLGAEAYRA